MTVEKLSFLASISVKQLLRIEHGGNTTVETLIKIANALRVDVSSLFENDNIDSLDIKLSSMIEVATVAKFQKLPKDKRDSFIAIQTILLNLLED